LLLLAATAYATIALFALLLADRVIFQPPRPSYRSDAPGITRIAVAGSDSLAVAFLPSPSARFTILYSHGNAEDLGHVLPFLHALRDLGFAVIGYDYRGYGRSARGPATARKAVEDAEAVHRYATTGLEIEPERLIIYGTSVGSGPAIELAARHRPAGLIVQSAFTSAFRVLTRVPLLPFDRFPNLKRLAAVRCPILVIHGTRDLVVPASQGRQLFSAAAEPKQALWVEGAGHNDLLHVAGQQYVQALREFEDLVGAQGRAR
jgi:fermentation-respiration switch protein FrsA (DUF1100 family)